MKQDIIDVIIETIKDFNEDLDEKDKLPIELNQPIYGNESSLDSLGLVSFIICLEQAIENKFDQAISLADEKAMSQKSNPYENINALTNFILSLLNSK